MVLTEEVKIVENSLEFEVEVSVHTITISSPHAIAKLYFDETSVRCRTPGKASSARL